MFKTNVSLYTLMNKISTQICITVRFLRTPVSSTEVNNPNSEVEWSSFVSV